VKGTKEEESGYGIYCLTFLKLLMCNVCKLHFKYYTICKLNSRSTPYYLTSLNTDCVLCVNSKCWPCTVCKLQSEFEKPSVNWILDLHHLQAEIWICPLKFSGLDVPSKIFKAHLECVLKRFRGMDAPSKKIRDTFQMCLKTFQDMYKICPKKYIYKISAYF
jgi:hypothetical protein